MFVEHFGEAKDPAAKLKEKEKEYVDLFANPYKAAERGYLDEVIKPEDTRRKLIFAFKASRRSWRGCRRYGPTVLA